MTHLIERAQRDAASLLPAILGTGDGDPYPAYARLRRTAPVYRDASGAWLVSSHRHVLDVLGEHAFACHPPKSAIPHADPLGFGETVVFADGDDHQRLRRLLAPMFSKARLAAVQHYVDAQVDSLLAPLRRRARFDLVAEVARELPVRTICFLLGFPDAAADAYRRASQGAWQLISFMPLSEAARRQAVTSTEGFLRDIDACIDACHDSRDATHPLAAFLALERRGAVSRREIAMNVLFLFIAGYGTTLLSIGNSVAAVLQSRAQWQSLRDDAALVPRAVRELLRYDPAVQALFRYAQADTELGGCRIRQGDQVILLIGSANRDANEFGQADTVDLHRATGRSLTFGAGPHGCMGVALARMQLESVLRGLLRHVPEIQLVQGDARRIQLGAFHGYAQLGVERSIQ
ncbi:cytochrome P450 [Burkholderia cepacia]|nr:cytochrome P450 [Burkholderia cepacia]